MTHTCYYSMETNCLSPRILMGGESVMSPNATWNDSWHDSCHNFCQLGTTDILWLPRNSAVYMLSWTELAFGLHGKYDVMVPNTNVVWDTNSETTVATCKVSHQLQQYIEHVCYKSCCNRPFGCLWLVEKRWNQLIPLTLTPRLLFWFDIYVLSKIQLYGDSMGYLNDTYVLIHTTIRIDKEFVERIYVSC